MGPFLTGPTKKKKNTIVDINYFTKWVEVESVGSIAEQKMEKFLREMIIYRYGIPLTIVTDNGRHFTNS